ncbi:MAG: hypothetical protein HQL27_07345 [Candidatus Omnitrophica bacterium]|nr:hypothetical protein [Candidatus Omnitrophota bacterium]
MWQGKAQAISHKPRAPDEVKLIKLADIYDNLLDSENTLDKYQVEKIQKKAVELIAMSRESRNPQLQEAVKIVELIADGAFKEKKVFAALIIDWDKYEYSSFIVNPTKTCYKEVAIVSQGFSGDDDGLSQRSTSFRKLGSLWSNSAIPLESSDVDAFNWVICFDINLVPYDSNLPVEKYTFHFPKYAMAYDGSKQILPVIYQTGQRIELEPRNS